MKLGCISWSVHRAFEEGRIDQIAWIKKCANEYELDGVELLENYFPCTDKQYLKDLKKLTIDLGLTIYGVAMSSDFSMDSREERSNQVEKVKNWLEISCYLGAPVLRIFSGIHRGTEKGKVLPNITHCMKKVAEYAEEAGIVLGLENHGETADDILTILGEVNSVWLKHLLDTGNYGWITGDYEHMYPSIEKTIPKAVLIHLRLIELDREGNEQKFDNDRVFKIIRKSNYRGFVSIEYEGEEDGLGVLPRGILRVKRYMGEILERT